MPPAPQCRRSPSALALAAALLCGALAAPAARADVAETGADDFRVSFMGGTGNPSFTALSPAIAYNATEHEYLVVWQGDTNTDGQVDDRYQIFAQRIDAATGAAVGSALVLSNELFAPSFIPSYEPSVAWNSESNQYLVVWSRVTGIPNEYDFELFARFFSAAGAALGPAAKISHMVDAAAINDSHYDAYSSSVAYNPAADEFLVVWSGDDGRGGRINEEFEIHGQRLDALSGAQLGTDDFRISDAGGTGNSASTAFAPVVVYNPNADEYLVVWNGDDLDAGTADGEFEIYGQRLAGATGAEIGTNDFRITTFGPAGDTNHFAGGAALAHDPDRNEYLVAFVGTETVTGTFQWGLEIYGQRLDAAGAPIGAAPIRLTEVGGSNETFFDADAPQVVYAPASRRYLVAYSADDDVGGQVDGEIEIGVQAVDAATGAPVGPDDLRVSDMGPNGTYLYQTVTPALAHDDDGGFLLAWRGDDDSGGLQNDEFEIFGQLLIDPALFLDGFETGSTAAWVQGP